MDKEQATNLRRQKAVSILSDYGVLAKLELAIQRLDSSVKIDVSLYSDEEKSLLVRAGTVLKYKVYYTDDSYKFILFNL